MTTPGSKEHDKGWGGRDFADKVCYCEGQSGGSSSAPPRETPAKDTNTNTGRYCNISIVTFGKKIDDTLIGEEELVTSHLNQDLMDVTTEMKAMLRKSREIS